MKAKFVLMKIRPPPRLLSARFFRKKIGFKMLYVYEKVSAKALLCLYIYISSQLS